MKVSSSSGRVCGGGGGGGVCDSGGGGYDNDAGSRGDGGGGCAPNNNNNSSNSNNNNNNNNSNSNSNSNNSNDVNNRRRSRSRSSSSNSPAGGGGRVVDDDGGYGGGGSGGGGGGEGGSGCGRGCGGGGGLVAGVLVSDQGEVISDRYVGVARRQFASRQGSERGSTKAEHSDSGDEETTLRQMLVSLQHQVTDMSANLTSRLDELQSRGVSPSPVAAYYGTEHAGHVETTVALSEIRSQLHHLTQSLESCQSEVTEVKRDMVAIKNELDTVQQVKEEIEELREYVDRLELQSHRRKLRLLEQGLTFFLSYTILASMLGMLQFGYNTGVINAPEENIEMFIKDVFRARYKKNMEDGQAELFYSFAVSIFAIGGMLGGFSGGIIANRFGRKGGLLLNSFVGIGGACLMGLTKYFNSYEVLFVGRFIIGVNCGLNTSLVPMYISEIAPLNLRGGLGTVNQLAVTTGLLISQILGVEQILGTDEGWPLLLGLAICPAILQLILLPVCPESPRYLLITKQWEEEARKALRKLRATNQIEEDIEEMRAEERAQQSEATVSMMELVCSPTLRQPLIISIVMQLSQQLSGINAVFYYSTKLYALAGLALHTAKFVTIGIGVIMVIMTLVTMPLMDRTGRRTLHLYGLGGMFIFSIFTTISLLIAEFFSFVQEMVEWLAFLAVVSTLGFVVFFAVGPGSIPWMITAELFSQGPRPAAMSIAVLINWVANFAVGIGFQPLRNSLENYTFLPFSVLLALFWIFTYKKVPETKNKTFEEILALFRQNGRGSVLEASRLYGSMLNYSNALDEHLPPSERASLMVAEEKPLPDSSPVQHSPTEPEVCAVCVNTGSSLMMTSSPNVTRRSSHTLSNHVCQMD